MNDRVDIEMYSDGKLFSNLLIVSDDDAVTVTTARHFSDAWASD